MIQTVSKKHWVTHELQGDMSTNKGAGSYNSKKVGVLYEWKKRFGRVSQAKIISWENLFTFSVKNTANNADTWGFIQ